MTPEVEQYLGMLDDLRSQVATLVANLPAEALNWRPIAGSDDHSTNSLAVLATHVAGAEQFWIAEVIGRRPATRDRDSEFATEADDATELVDRLNAVGAVTREVLGELNEEDLAGTRDVQERTVPVRWGILHVIDHTALHLGHMQLTYQLWSSGMAGPSPRWFERVDTDG